MPLLADETPRTSKPPPNVCATYSAGTRGASRRASWERQYVFPVSHLIGRSKATTNRRRSRQVSTMVTERRVLSPFIHQDPSSSIQPVRWGFSAMIPPRRPVPPSCLLRERSLQGQGEANR